MHPHSSKVVSMEGQPFRGSRYSGRYFALSPEAGVPVFSCRGLTVTLDNPVAAARIDADDFAIARALGSGVLVEVDPAAGSASRDVVMTPIVSSPLDGPEPAQASAPRIELPPGFGQEDKYLIRLPRPGFWRMAWLAAAGWISALLDVFAEIRFRRRMKKYRRNIERLMNP